MIWITPCHHLLLDRICYVYLLPLCPVACSGSQYDANRLCKVLVLFIDDDVVFIRTVGNLAVHLAMHGEVSTGIMRLKSLFQ